jgi:hypothetical protein
VRHRPPAILGRLAGYGQDLCDLFRAELAVTATTRQITEQILDRLGQRGLLLATFHNDQPMMGIRPPAPPNSDGMPLATNAFSDLLVFEPLKRQQNH